MEKESALSRIIDSVESYLNSHEVKWFYIGKTDNFEERAESHRQEGYNQIFELAIASSDAIAYLEDAVISYFKKKGDCRIKNENNGSGGNPQSRILYVACLVEMLSIDEIYRDLLPISDSFPIEIDKK